MMSQADGYLGTSPGSGHRVPREKLCCVSAPCPTLPLDARRLDLVLLPTRAKCPTDLELELFVLQQLGCTGKTSGN